MFRHNELEFLIDFFILKFKNISINILEYLAASQDRGLTAKDIAIGVNGPTGKSSDVNPILYSLLKSNKVSMNITPPRWKLSDNCGVVGISNKIIDILTKSKPMTAVQISTYLNLKSKSDVNPTLYSLKKMEY
jgi:hypothetical protein